MNIRNQLICAWSAIGFAAICLAGFLFANFIPPISPNLGAEEVATIYRENALSMRFGILLIMSSAGFICSFAAALAMQMKRIEGDLVPSLHTRNLAPAVSLRWCLCLPPCFGRGRHSGLITTLS